MNPYCESVEDHNGMLSIVKVLAEEHDQPTARQHLPRQIGTAWSNDQDNANLTRSTVNR